MIQNMRERIAITYTSPALWIWGLVLILVLGAGIGLWMSRDSGQLLSRLLQRRDLTWRVMQQRGAWRVGLDPSFPPFEMLNEEGAPVGFDVDLAERMAAQWGLRIEVVPMGYDGLLDALKAGKIDSVVSAIPYDPRATEDYAFSPPYFEAGVRLVVRIGEPIDDVEDLQHGTVAVEWGSMGDMAGRGLQRDGMNLDLAQFSTPEEAIDALVGDMSIDALLIDNITLREAQGRGAPVEAVGPPLESNPYVIVAPLTARDLQEQIAQALTQLQASGQLAELEAKWFADTQAVD